MIYKPDNFILEELVCKQVYDYLGEDAWSIFDPRLLITIDRIRHRLNKSIFINNWKDGGEYDERGFRCIQCSEVKKAIKENRMYVSAHMTGQAVDFDVMGLVAEEVRQYIIANQNIWPYPIRLEKNKPWVHLDCRDSNNGKIQEFEKQLKELTK